jgi:hypothetical protein
MIEVRGPHHRPLSIHHHQFGVNHGGLVFVNFSARLEQIAIGAAAGAARHAVIAVLAGHQDSHSHMPVSDGPDHLLA